MFVQMVNSYIYIAIFCQHFISHIYSISQTHIYTQTLTDTGSMVVFSVLAQTLLQELEAKGPNQLLYIPVQAG